jgi:hypothetical protein
VPDPDPQHRLTTIDICCPPQDGYFPIKKRLGGGGGGTEKKNLRSGLLEYNGWVLKLD